MAKGKMICAVVLVITVAAACKHQPQIIIPAENPVHNEPADTALCFERDILPIFITNCAKGGCHDAASHEEGYVFTSYETITSKKFVAGDAEDCELFEKMTEDDEDDIMPPPPAAPLPAAQIALIRDWINRGASNTTGCAVLCNSDQFNYAITIEPLLRKYCTGCHSTSSPGGGVILDIYTGAQTVALNGRLLGAVKRASGYKAMPQGGNKLSDCEILQIEKWIASGALNN